MPSAPPRLAALLLAGSLALALAACTIGQVDFAGKSCATDADCGGLACLDAVCGGNAAGSGGTGGGGPGGAGGEAGAGGGGGHAGCSPACAPGSACVGESCVPGTITFDPLAPLLSGTVRLAILAPPGLPQGAAAITLRLAGEVLATVELTEQAAGRYEGELDTAATADGTYDLHAAAGAAAPPPPVRVELDNSAPLLSITVERPLRTGAPDERLRSSYTLGMPLRITGRLTEQHPGPLEAVATFPGGITSSSGPTDSLPGGEFELLIPTAGIGFDAGEGQAEVVVSTADQLGHTASARGAAVITRLAFRTPAAVPLELRPFALREDDASFHASSALGLLTLLGPAGSQLAELAAPSDPPAYGAGLVISPGTFETMITEGTAFGLARRCATNNVAGAMIGFGPTEPGTRYYAAQGDTLTAMAQDCARSSTAAFGLPLGGGAVGTDGVYLHVSPDFFSSLRRLHDRGDGFDQVWEHPLPVPGPGSVLLAGGDVVFVGATGLVTAVPRESPPERFVFDLAEPVKGAPIVAFGSIWVPVGWGVRQIDLATGTELTAFPFPGGVASVFAGADQLLYVEELDPRETVIHAIDTTGTERWSFPTGVIGPTFPVPGCDGVLRLQLGDALGGLVTGATGVASTEPWPIAGHDTGRSNAEGSAHPVCP